MTDCRVETNGRDTILHLSGELLIDYAARLKSILVDALSISDRVEIDISSVTAVDVSCLQLFCAAHRTSTDTHKVMEFIDAPSSVFADMIRRSGCIRSGACVLDRITPCVWREERYDG